ncbi:hypothetical protein OQ496_14160 [Acetobacter suratthaniensis]|uniref:Uncharacterized protein n=1 Tax=Acetobacter suratthaniensis TaxID=1502841 RepID=A0ABS3LQA9_9PROT|nr:hypothetical protein [Acetobacter suratthaniensis]MBO1329556.1 hypothetical protein [Acetobacter suratthaniensis]MCX2567586.1 hypothetical protein [Acetobacter suratthaniensis]
MNNTEELIGLLSDYFLQKNGKPVRDELSQYVEAINTFEDLIAVDRDPCHPLWRVVPQIAMHRFGLETFQKFEPNYVADKSFVFVHPAHRHIVGSLKNSLQERWIVGKEIICALTPELINSLYGGYRWHAPYAAGCSYLGYLGQPATILPLASCSHKALRELIAYKNASRTALSKKIVVPGECLDQTMDAVIQAFHCPDVIENSRQLLDLELIDINDIYNK